MSAFMPGSYGMIGSIADKTGSIARGQSGLRAPGVGNIRQSLDQILAGPSTVLPGGGTLPTGSLAQREETEIPAATLSMYQAEPGRLMGLAGTEAGATEMGTAQDVLAQQLRSGVSDTLSRLLFGLGFSPLTAQFGGGGFNILSRLLGI